MSEASDQTSFDVEAPLGSTGLLMAELWYQTPPDLNSPELRQALGESLGAIEARDSAIMIPHADLTMEVEEGQLPLTTSVFAASDLQQPDKQKPDISQTWDWDGAAAALDRCQGSVLVSELLAEYFAPSQRVEAIRRVIGVLIKLTSPLAISWPNSQQITDPAAFEDHRLDGVINIRMFVVAEGKGERVMDSLGLQVFELPDVQCHYRDYDPGAVAALLYSTAGYLFEAGDVIDDGHTITGPDNNDPLICRHEQSLVEPAREVVDIDLGLPYAVGHRDVP